MKKDKSLLIIFLIVFIDLLGFGIILPLLPFIAEKYQANSFVIGTLTATYSFFQLIAAPILGRLSDRYGRKRLLVISQLGTLIGFLLLAFAKSLPLLFLSRIIDGITGGNISIAQAYISDITTKENRAKGMGLIGAAFGLGFIFGPIIGGLLAKISYSASALAASFISFITVVLTVIFLKETINLKKATASPKTSFNWKNLKEVLKNRLLLIIFTTFFLINFAFSLYQAILPLQTDKLFGYGPTENGILFSYIGILVVIVQLKIMPIFVAKFKERKTMIIGLYLLAVGLLMAALTKNLAVLILSVTFLPFGNGFFNPTIQALASEVSPKEEAGGVLGLLQSFGSLGRIIGPIIGGWLFLFSITFPFYLAVGLVVLSLIINKFFGKA